MTTLLYINAHPLEAHESLSVEAGEKFLASYREANPEHEIVVKNLYASEVPALDADILRGWGALRAGQTFDSLPEETRRKLAVLNEIVDQFVAADAYVFVSPMWNFSYPPALKAYIDAIAIAGKTFKYTAEGPVGLVSGKALHIQASGGIYSEGPAAGADFGHNHLRSSLQFFGISEFDKLAVEGHAMFPDRRDGIREDALEAAGALGRSF